MIDSQTQEKLDKFIEEANRIAAHAQKNRFTLSGFLLALIGLTLWSGNVDWPTSSFWMLSAAFISTLLATLGQLILGELDFLIPRVARYEFISEKKLNPVNDAAKTELRELEGLKTISIASLQSRTDKIINALLSSAVLFVLIGFLFGLPYIAK